jgi:hypothetical protein
MEKVGSGSGIIIPDPQHCSLLGHKMGSWLQTRSLWLSIPSKLPPFKYNPSAFFVFFEYILWWSRAKLRFCIGFNTDSDPDPAFEVKSDLDLLPNLVLRVLTNIFCKILQMEQISNFLIICPYASKNIPHFFTFIYFVGDFCPPGYGSNRPKSNNQSMRIRIYNTRQECVGHCIALSPV